MYEGSPSKAQTRRLAIRLAGRINGAVCHLFTAAAVVPEDEDKHCWARVDPKATWIHEERVIDALCPEAVAKDGRDYFDNRCATVKAVVDEASKAGGSAAAGISDETKQVMESNSRAGGSLAGNAARLPTKCKYTKCTKTNFVDDHKTGNIVCATCGTIATLNKIQDAPWKIKFKDDDVDPSFHGPPPDHRYSAAHNLRTKIQTMLSFRTSTGDGGEDKQRRAASQAFSLINAQNRVELNLSNYGRSTRAKTRQGYKDNMKGIVFEELEDACSQLQLHVRVQERAKDIYAQYRDNVAALRHTGLLKAVCIALGLRGTLDARRFHTSLVADVGGKGTRKRKRAEVKELTKMSRMQCAPMPICTAFRASTAPSALTPKSRAFST